MRFPLSRTAAGHARTELEKTPPNCECGGLIRPGIVWFGEQLPDEPWQAAVEAVATADVLVVVGTSGIVYPAAGLPDVALARGAIVVEVNPEQTPLSANATLTHPRVRQHGTAETAAAAAGAAGERLGPAAPGPARLPEPATAPRPGTSHSWRAVWIEKPAPAIARSVSRWVWQLPDIRGQIVASATRCSRPRQPGCAMCSK